MKLRRKPVAALAAVAVALAAVPAGSASAQTVPRTVPFAPPAILCLTLAHQAQWATMTGNVILANLIGRTLQIIGCGGAAI